jgi:type IV secretion system protein VirD4
MGAFAGYGLKAYLVCQSLNHITRAYGRDGVILDNCHIVTAFAAADMETARTIAAMAGETWAIARQESVSRPRAILAAQRGASSYREERRPLLLPGDVRQLPRDEQLIFVQGAPPIRARKLRFDSERVFRKRLCASREEPATLTTHHDWAGVRAIGRLVKGPRGAVRIEPGEGQGDLFTDLPLPEGAVPGFRSGRATGL